MLLITLIVLCWTTASIDFHLDRQYSLCCMKNITAITPLSNGGITIEAANPSVTILSGTDFSNKVAQIQADSSVSKIVVTLDGGVLFKTDKKIMRKTSQKPTNSTFYQYSLWSNMVLTEKYVLVGQKTNIPILKKIDLEKLKVQTYKFQPGEGQFEFPIYLSDLKNGQIVFGERDTIYLLNNETFSVDQMFVDSKTDITSIVSFSSSEESVIVIQGDLNKYQTYRYSQTSMKFEFFNRFYTMSTPLTLTSPTTAISIYWEQLLYWEDFDSQVIEQSWEQEEYIGSWRTVSLSNSQSLIVMTGTASQDNQIRFITLTADNKIVVNFTVQKPQGSILEGKFTEDDTSFIYNQKSLSTLGNELFKFDMATKKQTALMDGDQLINGLAFLIMKQRLIVFMNRTTKAIIENYVQLRNISTFQLISQFKVEVKLSKPPFGFKIIGNNYWNQNFMVIIQTQQYLVRTSSYFRFRVIGNQIEQLPLEINNLEFLNSFACNKYLINAVSYSTIQVYFAQNMTFIRNMSANLRYDTFFSQKDVLIGEYFRGPPSFVYDFSYDIDSWERGLFFKQYFTVQKVRKVRNYLRVLFPKRGLYLFCNTGPVEDDFPVKMIYDLTKIPVKKISPLPVQTIQLSVVLKSPTDSSCVWAFILSEKKLLKHNECDPSKPQIITYEAINNPKLSVSTNKKYLFVVYNQQPYPIYDFTIEVRLITNITKLVKQFILSRYTQPFQNIDVTTDEKIIIQLFTHVLIFDMEPQQMASNFGIESIDLFDACNDVIAITGKSSINPNVSLLIVKKLNAPLILFEKILSIFPMAAKLSQSAAMIAVYGYDSKLSVWDVKSEIPIIESKFQGVLDMRFINDDKILLEFASNISIISLDNFLATANSQLSMSFTKIAVNQDGTLIAALLNSKAVKVFNASMSEVANFVAPFSNIVDVGFSLKDELFAVTSNGILFVLSPTPCPATFINVDAVCLCPKNATNKTGSCSCKTNFTKQQDECLCLNEFTFDGNKCFCNANASVIGSVCTCRETFVNLDSKCLCPSELTYANGRCIQCSFMCSSCDGTGTFDCTSYSSSFFIGIAGVCVVGLALVVIIACFVKRRREKGSVLETNLTENKSQNSLSEQLYNKTGKK